MTRRDVPTTEPAAPVPVEQVPCDDCDGTGACPICRDDAHEVVATCGCADGACPICRGRGSITRAVDR